MPASASLPRSPRTIPAALAARLRSSPGDPFVTFYDLDTGERVELSMTTWVNWAAKVAGLFTEELELEKGARVRIDLGAHWQASVLLGGAWWAGVCVVAPEMPGAVEATVCAERDVARYRDAETNPLLASSLKPMAGPCGPLPDGVLDFTREVLSMPDAYAPLDAPEADDVAWQDASAVVTQREAVADPHDDRVLTDAAPASPEGVRILAGALAGTGSLVLVQRHGHEVPTALSSQERVTRAQLGGRDTRPVRFSRAGCRR